MNRLWVPLLCALTCLVPAVAQDVPKPESTPQSGAVPSSAGDTPNISSYSQEPFIIEQYSTTMRYENDGTGEQDTVVRIRVQSEAGVQQLGELTFGYNSANEQMEVRYVRVHKADGTVATTAPDAIKEMTATVARDAPVYTDYKEKHISVPALRPGETLEYDIAIRKVTALAPGEFWYQRNFVGGAIVLDERLEVNLPLNRKVNIKSSFSHSTDKDEANGRIVYRWKQSNLTRLTDEEMKKKAQNQKDAAPDVEFTTFASWQDVARWYAGLERGRTAPTPEIRAKTEQLVQGRTNDLDKMQAVYDYVSKNIRYVSLSFGLSRYQPHLPGEVFTNQYGDCKDKATLLASMLEAAGIRADAVLIPSSAKLDISMPSPSQFDHVITAVPLGKDLIWMDSTAEVAPFRLLASPLRDKSALLVPADGAGKIVETPADPPFPSTQDAAIEAQVTELGKLTGKIQYTLRGDTEFVLRLAFRRTPETKWKDLAQAILRFDGIHGDVTSVKPSDPSDTQHPFRVEMEFTQLNFFDWSSKKARVALPLGTMGMPDASEENAQPIKLGSPLDATTRVKLTLPENIQAQPPVAIAVARDYAEFKSSYHVDGHVLTAERSLHFKMRELPADRTSDYLAFVRAVQADEGQLLAIENSTTGAPEIPATSKSDELLEAGAAALNSGNPRAAIPLFQRVVSLDPKHKVAWNDLGLAYLRLGQFGDAADAFRKQIEVNPYDEHSYDYLGVTLQQAQKNDEAIAAFRKQVELNPLDKVAHASLGSIYLDQHKYADAIPELDKATVLTPDSAGLQVSLGQAYMNTGDKEKALAAFQKGVEISQSPAVWNNVAFNLADHKLDLDRAKQYAESAVSATAASLRNIELPNLKNEDLNEVAAIGNFWDTLGWVDFQNGDLDSAERYIRAAWLLNEHGGVSDHLAQIYEKRGHKDQAAHMYALAMAAPHSDPDTSARFTLLLGSNTQIKDLLSRAKPELTTLRSLPAGKLLAEDAKADFVVLLSSGEKTAHVDAVQFVSGSEKLRPFADRLRSLDYGPMFPDASAVKLVRRGTLTCSAATGDCVFLLLLPEEVHTVN